MKRRLPFVVLALLALVLPARAAEQTLRLDPQKTRVTFSLGATMHTVHGSVPLTAVEILFELESGAASGNVRFDARRTETGNEKRDKKMHSKVLESERFPDIVFSPSRVEGGLTSLGRMEITLHGSVSIHGTEHPISLEAVVEIEGDGISGSFDFTVPYVAWGMKDPSVMLLRTAKEVEVTVEVQGTLE